MVTVEMRNMFSETGKSKMVHDTIVATGFSVQQHWRSSRGYCKQALYKVSFLYADTYVWCFSVNKKWRLSAQRPGT